MSTRPVNCLILTCDGCRQDYGADDGITRHYDTVSSAISEARLDDWRTDGTHHWCPGCQLESHTCTPHPEDPERCARCWADLDETEPTPGADRD